MPVAIEVIDTYYFDHTENIESAILYNVASVLEAEKAGEIIDQACLYMSLPPCGECISVGSQVVQEVYDRYFDSKLKNVQLQLLYNICTIRVSIWKQNILMIMHWMNVIVIITALTAP